MAKKSILTERLEAVREKIADACAKARREPGEVTLVAVTKNAAPEQIREIVQLGVCDLGENRVQQLIQRAPQINEFFARRAGLGSISPPKLRWHMIGHLQRNKVKSILPIVHMIHSVDSLRLAEELDVQCERLNRKLPVMLQINASEETSKFGVAVGAALHLGEQIASMDNLQLVGLMSMAPLTDDRDVIRKCFERTREVFEEMKWHKIGKNGFKHLSMGMTHDYEIAIEEGATMVRIGTDLFGEKPEGAVESGD
ncbi:MAG TPA: YggS family pyridoxal phosphate-dependent enzyme [Tepidisphaeraceae bacterium]|nr:YggS family pyridoxal phosphate-dependent enzyme [Tepidisphaeraceae bacterium]